MSEQSDKVISEKESRELGESLINQAREAGFHGSFILMPIGKDTGMVGAYMSSINGTGNRPFAVMLETINLFFSGELPNSCIDVLELYAESIERKKTMVEMEALVNQVLGEGKAQAH